MKLLKTRLPLICVLLTLTLSFQSRAQKLDIAWLELDGSNVIVHYALEDSNPMHAYTVSLYSSADNFANPLVKLSGDAGNEVKAGADKRITWRVTEELGQFVGELELEIRAKMYVPFMRMNEFTKTRYKRGKNYPLVWRSGSLGGHVDIELIRHGVRVSSDRNVANTGKFDWQIPAHAKAASGYQLKFTNTKSRDETFITKPFRVVAKVPKLAKIVAGVSLGTAVYFLTKKSPPPIDPDLPPQDELPGGN